jgi:hypothetical protein
VSDRIESQLFRRDKHLCKGTKWTYTYAFFADMGGIHLTSPDFPDGFPIDAEQLHYLVLHKHVDFPDMALMSIAERNTLDTLSRYISAHILPAHHQTYFDTASSPSSKPSGSS